VTVVSLVVLAAVLVGVVRRPWGLPEVAFALPGALLVLILAVEPWSGARHAMGELASTVAFLGAVLVLAEVAAAAGLFDAAGQLLARVGNGGEQRLLLAVAGLAVAVTTVLSLDATVVLFTPVVIHAVRGRRRRVADASLLAVVFLANGGSLFLPVANLTNLLVVERQHIGFGGFLLRMALPGLVSVAVITFACWRVVPRSSAGKGPAPCGAGAASMTSTSGPSLDSAGRAVAAGLAAVLVGFFVASSLGFAPAVVAIAGALFLGGGLLIAGRARAVDLARAANPGFLTFVFALAVVVDGVARHGAGRWLVDRVPTGDGLAALLVMAGLAAVAANLVNNLPATLLLLPALHGQPLALALAALLGLNIGPNLTYPGSLATLLWRRVVRRDRCEPSAGTFLRTSAMATPAALGLSVLALWLVTSVA